MPSIEDITYVAPPSIGHEIGIMFGFLGAMALTTGLYVVAWKYGNKRGVRKEQERVQSLRDGGFLGEREKSDAGDDHEQYTANEITTM